ncbi:MAG: hypothetical protein LC098_02750 [Burkholderiales bacterium]|nr:hypothetical protein [Burkholderiales bacterium]
MENLRKRNAACGCVRYLDGGTDAPTALDGGRYARTKTLGWYSPAAANCVAAIGAPVLGATGKAALACRKNVDPAPLRGARRATAKPFLIQERTNNFRTQNPSIKGLAR